MPSAPDDRDALIAELRRRVAELERAAAEWPRPPAPVAHFDSAFNATSDGVLIVDLSDRVVYHNEPFRLMWRFDAPLPVGREDYSGLRKVLEQAADPEAFLATVRRLRATPDAESDAVVPIRDGRILEARSQPQRLDGRPIGRVWWFRDVTDRHRIERELRQSEERFSHLFLASPFSILLATYPEGRIVDVNPAFTRLFERERHDLIGKTTAEIHFWAEAADRHRMIARLEAGEPVREMEFTFTTRAGERRVVLLSIELVELDGQWHSLASSVDLTGQKAIEAALRESETRYRTLFEAIGETIFLIAEDGRFLALNRAFEAATGYGREEWLGRPFADLVHPDDREKSLQLFHRAVAGERDVVLDLRFRHRNGEWIVVECSSVHPVLEDGRVTGFLGTGRDVTRQRQLEENLRQAQKIEALGTLAGGIAHDFNNILAAIAGHADFLRARLAGREDVAEDMAGIVGATARAKALVRQILTFGRQHPETREVIALAPVVREALALLRATLPATITIVADLADPEALILADPTRIHQVIVNLGTNAVHAMRTGGGTLELTQRVVELPRPGMPLPAGLQPGRFVRLTVADTGQGMEPDVLRRVFDPFFTTKRPSEGTGLGLAVVHGIVRGHGGEIVVESVPGRGTTATLYFPEAVALSPPPASETVSPSEPQPGRGETVMFVDDERGLVHLASRMLEQLGYRARGFTAPEEALAAFLAEPAAVDVVITDLTMPGLTGADLARQMRARRPELPVVLTTGYVGALATDELREIGIRELIPKPFDLAAIADAVARAIRPGPGPLSTG